MVLPIVIASGQLLTQAVWQPVIEAWPDREVVFADNRHDDTIAGFATRLLANGPPKFVLIAHAMGGFVAFEVMRRAPERVEKLVLIATLAAGDGPAQTVRRQRYIDLVSSRQFDQVVEERIPILFPEDKRDDPFLIGLARQMAFETGAETFLAQQRAIMGRIDSRPSLADINIPTLLIHGSEDGITTPAQQDEMLAAIPKARLETIEGVGHLPTLEAPAIIALMIADFISVQH